MYSKFSSSQPRQRLPVCLENTPKVENVVPIIAFENSWKMHGSASIAGAEEVITSGTMTS